MYYNEGSATIDFHCYVTLQSWLDSVIANLVPEIPIYRIRVYELCDLQYIDKQCNNNTTITV